MCQGEEHATTRVVLRFLNDRKPESIQVPKNIEIGALKILVREKLPDLASASLRLIHKGRVLSESQTLADYGSGTELVVYVVPKAEAAEPTPPPVHAAPAPAPAPAPGPAPGAAGFSSEGPGLGSGAGGGIPGIPGAFSLLDFPSTLFSSLQAAQQQAAQQPDDSANNEAMQGMLGHMFGEMANLFATHAGGGTAPVMMNLGNPTITVRQVPPADQAAVNTPAERTTHRVTETTTTTESNGPHGQVTTTSAVINGQPVTQHNVTPNRPPHGAPAAPQQRITETNTIPLVQHQRTTETNTIPRTQQSHTTPHRISQSNTVPHQHEGPRASNEHQRAHSRAHFLQLCRAGAAREEDQAAANRVPPASNTLHPNRRPNVQPARQSTQQQTPAAATASAGATPVVSDCRCCHCVANAVGHAPAHPPVVEIRTHSFNAGERAMAVAVLPISIQLNPVVDQAPVAGPPESNHIASHLFETNEMPWEELFDLYSLLDLPLDPDEMILSDDDEETGMENVAKFFRLLVAARTYCSGLLTRIQRAAEGHGPKPTVQDISRVNVALAAELRVLQSMAMAASNNPDAGRVLSMQRQHDEENEEEGSDQYEEE